jgi:hypothetical protein
LQKAPVIATVVILLAAALAPLAMAQEDGARSAVAAGELGTFGQDYVESLALWSGAGVHLVYGPSFDGDDDALMVRLAQLGTAVGGDMPEHVQPVMLPWAVSDPGFATPAPIDHSAPWLWNQTGVVATVDIAALGATLAAESAYAWKMLDGEHDGKLGATPLAAAKGALVVLAAAEAVAYLAESLGWNGTDRMPLNLSDPNMTDADPSNGWWLPGSSATGDLNLTHSPSEWTVTALEPQTLDSTASLVWGLAALTGLLEAKWGLAGDDMPFPNEVKDMVRDVTTAIYWNMIGLYYDAPEGAFHNGNVPVTAEGAARLYLAMDAVYDGLGGYEPSNDAQANRDALAATMLRMQQSDGTIVDGYTVNRGLRMSMDTAPLAGHAWAARALYDASFQFGGVAYGAAARACLAAMDRGFWNSTLDLYIADGADTTPRATASDEAAAMGALSAAAELGKVELARHRLGQLWHGMVGAGMQLSETNLTGENYTMPGNDTDGDGIMKHDAERGAARPFGVAPVLAWASDYDNATGNWTLVDGGMMSTGALMLAALVMMPLDATWAAANAVPATTEEHARMLLLWSEEELAAWMDERVQEVADLEADLASLQAEAGSAAAEVASLRENLTRVLLDLNESRENVTVLNNSVTWLRIKLEQTNDTVDNMTKEIEVLSDRISRLERDLTWKDENVTKLEVQLRAERNNVTQLNWTLANTTMNLTDAQRDLKAAQDKLQKTEDDMADQEDRAGTVAIVAFVAGFLIALVLMWLRARAKSAASN